eukprot:s4619_g7.t1
MRPWSPLSRVLASLTPARPHKMEQCSAAKWVGGGTLTQCSWSSASRCPSRVQSPAGCASPCEKQRAPAAGGARFPVQQAVGHTALGCAWAMPGPAHNTDVQALDEVLDVADPDLPSRLPLR